MNGGGELLKKVETGTGEVMAKELDLGDQNIININKTGRQIT